jgi:hypothetical protein
VDGLFWRYVREGLDCVAQQLTHSFLKEKKQMADTIYAPDPWSALSAQHSDIRREGSVERGELRYDLATKTGDVRREIAEGVSNVRREQAVGFDETRYAVAGSGSDIRREQAIAFGDTKYSIAAHSEDTNRDILTSGYNVRQKVDEVGDAILQRNADYFIAGQARDFDSARDLAALRATTDLAAQKISTEILLAAEKNATATALESAKVAAAVALGQAQLSHQVAEGKYETSKQMAYENEKTRDLINSLKNDELNRILIERNTDLNGCRQDYFGARDGLFNAQFAALSSQVNSQVNAVNSQLSDTRQGMVNFGRMSDVGQGATSNAVR